MEAGSEYHDDAVAACKSVMIEVLTILGKHREHVVVVGGWVPPILFGSGTHVGSIDVDLAVDWRTTPKHVYETIQRELSGRGYYNAPEGPPNRFLRDVHLAGKSYSIHVDVITGSDANAPGRTHQLIQGMPVWCAGGVSVALDHFVETELTGTLPDGGHNTVPVRVASAGAFIAMKGLALSERMKEKDAYDIYYCCVHHPSGIVGLIAEIRGILHLSEVQQSLAHIREKFETIESIGPVWAASVVAAGGGDYERTRRDAFERVRLLVQSLGFNR